MQKPTRILICDDTITLLDYLGFVFEKQGFNVIKTALGEQALEKARVESPDILLIDVMMPGIDGLEVCRRLRAQTETHDVPILLYSATVGEEIRRDALDAGANELLGKTLHHAELVSRVRDWLALQHLPGGIGIPEAVEGLKDVRELFDTEMVWLLSACNGSLEDLALVCRAGEQEARRVMEMLGRGPYPMDTGFPPGVALLERRRYFHLSVHELSQMPSSAGLARALVHLGAYRVNIYPLQSPEKTQGVLVFSSPAILIDDEESNRLAGIALRFAAGMLGLWVRRANG